MKFKEFLESQPVWVRIIACPFLYVWMIFMIIEFIPIAIVALINSAYNRIK